MNPDRCDAMLGALGDQFPPCARELTHVADLGCFDGAYTIELARAGYRATGIDARERHITYCRSVADSAGIPRVRFIRDDVRNLEQHGPFDAAYCGGLLYHLDQPVAFLSLLGKVIRQMIVVETHYSTSCHEEWEGYRGSWYADNPAETDPWGSWHNTHSFWLGQEDLIAAMYQAGFSTVWHVQDDKEQAGRAMFAGLK